jgi:hypothetical protein
MAQASRSALDRIWVETVARYPIDLSGLAVAKGPVRWGDGHRLKKTSSRRTCSLCCNWATTALSDAAFCSGLATSRKIQLDEDAVFGPVETAAKAEGVRHWVARYLDIRGGVSRNPSPSKTGYKIRYGRWEALWPCFGEPTATAPGVWHTTSRTALLTKRSAVRSTNHLVTKRALGRSEMWPRRQERTPHLTQAHRAVPS